MSDNNGWPGKPGVPLNPEREGWHWVQEPSEDVECCLWRPKPWRGENCGFWQMKSTEDDFEPHEISNWRYIAPVLNSAEVDARIAAAHKEWLAELNHDTDALMEQARESALEEAAQRAAHYERMAYQHGNLSVDDPHECAAQVAREIEASIRALKGEGDE